MGKKDKKSKKQQDDYWDNEFENDIEDPIAAANEAAKKKELESVPPSPPPSTSQDKNGDAADEEEENGGGGLMSALRKSKAKNGEQQSGNHTPDEPEQQQEVHVQVKSKKEKEREKKEREKLRKKQQAERKKAEVKKTGGTANEAANKDDSTSAAAPSGGSNEPPAKEETGGKSKKKSAAILALQKQMQRQRELEEEQRRIEQEEKQRILEEQRLAEEEEQRQEEARRLKKEREKKKKEELRSQGKLLTKKQREQQQLMEKRRQALLQSGVQIAGISGEPPKKPVYTKKKGKNHPPPPQQETKPSTPPEQPKTQDKTTLEDKTDTKEHTKEEETKEGDQPLLDSWEAAVNSDGEVQASWEDEAAESEHDEEEKTSKELSPVSKSDQEDQEQDETSSSEEDEKTVSQRQAVEEQRKNDAKERREKRHQEAVEAQSQDNLRSPICCILGHVDTGKTKLLDKIRQTNVQEGEAGGITQQIGATYFPIDAIKQKTAVMKSDLEYKIPGLLIIDTPGHESFTNLRSRGSSLCNIAILVVDIMHGLEPQTLESIRLLRDRKTPFIVALNKIDRLYDWKAIPNNAFRKSLAKQKKSVQREFEDRLQKTKVAFAEQGLNSEVYYNNKNMAKNVSLVPTSAVTGEGVPDLLMLLVQLTQTRMSAQLMYLSEVACTVLEVKVVEGLGTTIDVVLSNGILHEGDRIVLCGLNGPIATNIRALLTPPPSRELRIKSEYVHHKEVKAALGVKIAANDLEKAVAGSRLLVVGPDDDEEELKDEVMSDLTGLLDYVDKTGKGVWVQASTLGSLEALLDFLKDSKIPVMGISLGPVYKKDVMRAAAMLEKAPQFAVMLCFDVKIDKEAEHFAEQEGVKIFKADIIYHLFDQFTAYQTRLLEEKRKDNLANAIYPVVLKTIQIINKRNPMIIGVDIVDGSLRLGTPICAVRKDAATGERQILNLGRVSGLEVNHKPLDNIRKAQAGAGVAMRIDTQPGQPTWGRHIDETDMLYSEITRQSIDTLKDPAFRDTVTRDDWILIRNLKNTLGVS